MQLEHSRVPIAIFILMLTAACVRAASRPVGNSDSGARGMEEIAGHRGGDMNTRDCDGDGISDLVIGSSDWPFPESIGKVVVYSGKTFESVMECRGAQAGAHFGHSAVIVDDVDGDGLADVACASREISPTESRFIIELHSGRSGALIKRIPAKRGLDHSLLRLAAQPHKPMQSIGRLAIGYVYSNSQDLMSCGTVELLALDTFDAAWSIHGHQSDDHLGAFLACVAVDSGRSSILLAGTAQRGWGDGACMIGAGPTRIELCYPNGLGEPEHQVRAACARSALILEPESREVIICGIPSRIESDDSVNRVIAFELGTGKALDTLIEHRGNDGFGQAVALALDNRGVLKAVLVGAPESTGAVWMYRSLKDSNPRRISSGELSDSFGCSLYEVDDVNGDGVTDVVACGRALHCKEQVGFEVLSGADGAVLRQVIPVQ